MASKSHSHKFTERIRKPSDPKSATSWGFVVLPKSVSDSLSRRGRLTANVEINGVMSLVTLEPDGKLSHWLRIDSALMEEAGVAFGDQVEVNLNPLKQALKPNPPADFAKTLKANPKALEIWNLTTTLAQIDWIHWIESAKQGKRPIFAVLD
jgi:Domain of unknown function (DUF1905)/Bacteriocin-protection, YdeI or OmpD-Associated